MSADVANVLLRALRKARVRGADTTEVERTLESFDRARGFRRSAVSSKDGPFKGLDMTGWLLLAGTVKVVRRAPNQGRTPAWLYRFVFCGHESVATGTWLRQRHKAGQAINCQECACARVGSK